MFFISGGGDEKLCCGCVVSVGGMRKRRVGGWFGNEVIDQWESEQIGGVCVAFAFCYHLLYLWVLYCTQFT